MPKQKSVKKPSSAPVKPAAPAPVVFTTQKGAPMEYPLGGYNLPDLVQKSQQEYLDAQKRYRDAWRSVTLPDFTAEEVPPSPIDMELARMQAISSVPVPLQRVPEPVLPSYASAPQVPTRPAVRTDRFSLGLGALASLFAGEHAGQVAAAPLQAAISAAEQEYADRYREFEAKWREVMERNRQEAERAAAISQYQRDVAEAEYKRALSQMEVERSRAAIPAFSSLAAQSRQAQVLAGQRNVNAQRAQMQMEELNHRRAEAEAAGRMYTTLLGIGAQSDEAEKERRLRLYLGEKEIESRRELEHLRGKYGLMERQIQETGADRRQAQALNNQSRWNKEAEKIYDELDNTDAEIVRQSAILDGLTAQKLQIETEMRSPTGPDILKLPDRLFKVNQSINEVRAKLLSLQQKRESLSRRLGQAQFSAPPSTQQSLSPNASLLEKFNRLKSLSDLLGDK